MRPLLPINRYKSSRKARAWSFTHEYLIKYEAHSQNYETNLSKSYRKNTEMPQTSKIVSSKQNK